MRKFTYSLQEGKKQFKKNNTFTSKRKSYIKYGFAINTKKYKIHVLEKPDK